MTRETLLFAKGDLGESYPWEICFDVVVFRYSESTVCEHCAEIGEGHSMYKAEYAKYGRSWVCPAVVVARNQSRYDSTFVCLACILEAAKKFNLGGA